MVLVSFLSFINVSHTKDEIIAIAKEYDIDDVPNEQGEVLKRPRTVFILKY